MLRNSQKCPHCGKTFVRITGQTPLVNRSDGTFFHVTLFAGPDPRAKFSGDFYDNQVICNFAYAHVQLGLKDHTVTIVITKAEKDPEEVLDQVEDAADKLAELVEEGHRLTAVYTFTGLRLTPGFPI